MASRTETDKAEITVSFSAQNNPQSHRILTEVELALFRTQLCEAQCRGSCLDPDKCAHSHCLTWQRRNPLRIFYSPTLCPDIEFVRRNSRMVLVRRCIRGRTCPYAHSKEEELYHPMMYKTKLCKVHPGCRRYHCPFAHTASELRRRMTAEEYYAAKFTAPEMESSWGSRGPDQHSRTKSPCSGMTSTMTTEASATGTDHNFLLRSPNSVQINSSNGSIGVCDIGTTSPRSLPNMTSQALFTMKDRRRRQCETSTLRDLQEPSCAFAKSADPFQSSMQVEPGQQEILRGLESILDKLVTFQSQRADFSQHESKARVNAAQSSPHLGDSPQSPLAPPEVSSQCLENEVLWKEIATALMSVTTESHGQDDLGYCPSASAGIQRDTDSIMHPLIAVSTKADGHEQSTSTVDRLQIALDFPT